MPDLLSLQTEAAPANDLHLMPSALDSMLYTYWDDDNSQIDSVKAWDDAGMPVKVFRRAEFLSIVKSEYSAYNNLVEAIALPAARSDVARIVLGLKYGGLYIDAHVGPPTDMKSMQMLLQNARDHDIVLLDKANMRKPPANIHLINTVIACRQGSDLVSALLQKILMNLQAQYSSECAGELIPYNLAVLTGAWNLRELFFVESIDGSLMLRPELQNRIHIQSICADLSIDPVRLYAFYGYRKPGSHWSERQLSEPLFKRD